MKPKKICIIAVYFPPLNSTGARRPEALVKYLANQGHRVAVLTTRKRKVVVSDEVDNGVTVIESSFCRTTFFNKISSSEFDNASGNFLVSILINFKRQVINRTVGQLLDPRIPFVCQIVFKLLLFKISGGRLFNWVSKIAESEVVITTSPPWITHFLGVIIKKIFKIKLIIDYRDQFSANHMFSGWFTNLELILDNFFCKNSDIVTVISEPMRQYYFNIKQSSVLTIMNGYDPELFPLIKDTTNVVKDLKSGKRIVRYFGTITSDRLMEPLWEAILKSKLQDKYIFQFFGECGLLKLYLKNAGIIGQIDINFVPRVGYKEAISLMLTADALLFSETSETAHASQRGVLTSKLFEYIATCRPIIGIIDKSTVAGQIIDRSNLSVVLSNDTTEIGIMLHEFCNCTQTVGDFEFIRSFSRIAQFEILNNQINAL